jgi:predicted nuclease of predicted toxin-antitoxin system
MPLRLCADENIPDEVVALLRVAGHDVLSVSEYQPGLIDRDVLHLASRESRILVTFDKKDFGELIFLRGAGAPPGLILFRIADMDVADRPHFMLRTVESRNDWGGNFSTVSSSAIRSRALPEQ